MTTKKNVVKVTILGDDYSIKSDQSPERTRIVAEYVDDIIRQTMRAGNIVDDKKGAILAALSITDELFDARESGQELAGSMKRLSAEIRPWLPPAKRKD
ncbi:MAG TPA: cell division protein ZapA [Gemmatimonadaceae bacterium]|nr:cell division protein ZapA [Gemmatimonadaceae bacterium]